MHLAVSVKRYVVASPMGSQTTPSCHEYKQVICELQGLQLPLTIYTIYDAVPGLDDASLAGLAIFNDIITRTAFKESLSLIDLRLLYDEPADYSELSPIEPRGVKKVE